MKKLLSLVLPHKRLFMLALASLVMSAFFGAALIATLKPLLDQGLFGNTAKTEQTSQVDRVFSYQDELLQDLKTWVEDMGFTFESIKSSTELDFENPLPWALLVVGIFFLQALFEFLGAYTIGKIGLTVIVDLRQRLMDHISMMSMSFFKEMNTGDIISRVGVDVNRIRNAISVKLGEFVKEMALAVVSVIVLFLLNWKLSLTLFILVPLIGSPIVIFSRKIRKNASKSQTFLGQMTGHLKEVLVGIRIVKAFGKEQFESDKLKRTNQSFFKYALRELKFVTITTPVLGLVGITVIATFVVFGSIIIQTTSMSQGDFMVFVVFVYNLYQPIKRMARANNEIQQAAGIIPRINSILAWENSLPEINKPRRTAYFPDVREIEFRDVSFWYDGDQQDQPVLDKVSFTVKLGEHIALVGSSGSGKSTLVNLIPRFFDVCEGQILFDGVDIRDLYKRELRQTLAIVTQETILFNDTVQNNIAYGMSDVKEEEVHEAAKKAFASGFIDEMPNKYQTVLGEAGTRLSGGQKQRLSIARAIMKNAPILILDEATSALDTESEREVQLALNNLMKEKTSFVIAHRLSTIRNANRIFVLDKGKIVEQGSHQELVNKKGIYFKLEQMQQGGFNAF
ncbi:MAG: ABC transporter permease [Acidobacteria bacterium]|nr:MAG: ABC transporter permease [Acidobacteriota bacterium]